MRRRSLLSVSLLIPALVIVALAVWSGTGPGGDDADVRLAAATSSDPADGTVPPTLLTPFDTDESRCPGLDSDPELIPPSFHTQAEPIPDPEPIEVCPLLQHAAGRGDSPPGDR